MCLAQSNAGDIGRGGSDHRREDWPGYTATAPSAHTQG